jgi:hypothetical protein
MIVFGAQAIIGVVALSIMGCTLTTNLAITTLGDLAWMHTAKTGLAMKMMVNQTLLPPSLQKVLLRNLLSMTSLAMRSALRLAFLLKQLIESGKMPRETVGLNHERSSTWILATFCFLLLFPIQMTLLLPPIFYSTIKIFTKFMNAVAYTLYYIEHDFPSKLLSWLSYLFFPGIIAMLSSCHFMVRKNMTIPIYFWMLLWHPDGHPILDMLCSPEGNSRLV